MTAGPVFVTGGSGFVGRHLIRALVARGHRVRALARHEHAEAAVDAAGAEFVRGDLLDAESLTQAMVGCNAVVHAAGETSFGAESTRSLAVHVAGAENLILASRRVGVQRIVHVGAAAVVKEHGPVLDADETWPLRTPAYSPHIKTHATVERLVLAADGDWLTTVVVRPPLIWGTGQPLFLRALIERVRAGQWRWITGARFPFATCHVANLCAGVLAALDRGRGGEAYFVADDERTDLRAFLEELLATQGLAIDAGSIPYPIALGAASLLERTWKMLRRDGEPPLRVAAVRLMGQAFTIRDDKARRDLLYRPVISRDLGMAELRAFDKARPRDDHAALRG